jgi:hypothetical protein
MCAVRVCVSASVADWSAIQMVVRATDALLPAGNRVHEDRPCTQVRVNRELAGGVECLCGSRFPGCGHYTLSEKLAGAESHSSLVDLPAQSRRPGWKDILTRYSSLAAGALRNCRRPSENVPTSLRMASPTKRIVSSARSPASACPAPQASVNTMGINPRSVA